MSNTSIISINNREVVFENKDERVFYTSLGVAKVSGKQHKYILKLISEKSNDNEIKGFYEPDFQLSFKTREIEGFGGREGKYPYYQLTGDGFSSIAMGLTDRKVDKFRIAFINTFNEMERIIKSQYTLKLENYNKYKVPNTPYRESIVRATIQAEQSRSCKFEELIAYEIKEIYKDSKSHIE